MAKKNFVDDTKDVLGLGMVTKTDEVQRAPESPKKPAIEYQAASTVPVAQPPSLPDKKGSSPRPTPVREKDKRKQRGYYLSEVEYRALKLRSVISMDPNETELSNIVSAAIRAYLPDEIKKVEEMMGGMQA